MQLTKKTIEALVVGCEENTQTRAIVIDYCFEIFRRALDEENPDAWQALTDQYHRLICLWIRRATNYAYPPDDIEEIAQEALIKLWRTLTPHPVAEKFANTPAMMGYLNRCTVSTLHDWQRRQQRHNKLDQRLSGEWAGKQDRVGSFEGGLHERLQRDEQIGRVQNWMSQHVTDEVEQLLIKLTFEDGLTPKQIVAQHAAHFPSTRYVRRIKERVLKRARRFLQN